MSNQNIRPSSMEGIKRLAKSIKTSQAIPHTEALNHAAKQAGYQNFSHARNHFKANIQQGSTQYCVFITSYWHDKETQEKGRETLPVWLDHLWSDLISPEMRRYTRFMGDFRAEGPDHLADRYTATSQFRARDHVCALARVLQFMDATNLTPTKSTQVYPGGRSSNAIPGHDHGSAWYDRSSKRYLYVDEPYGRDLESTKLAEWLSKFDQKIELSSWPGMYYPGGSEMYLVTDRKKGVPLEPIISALESLRMPYVADNWEGESAPNLPIFVSPGAVEKHKLSIEKTKKAITRSPTLGPRKTVGYIQTFVGQKRRPRGKMPIAIHHQVSRLLSGILAESYYRSGVYNRVDSVRDELDEWVQREYNRSELSNEDFSDLYYRQFESKDPRSLKPEEKTRHIDSLNKIKTILSSQYPDCSPLKTLLKKLDAAIKSMEAWPT